jgi:hypothetical protein
MKYLIFYEFKEPVEDNIKKDLEIEKARIEKGEALWHSGSFYAGYYLLSEPKAFMIVDTDATSIAKWIAAYGSIMNYKISPIMTREEWEKATQ